MEALHGIPWAFYQFYLVVHLRKGKEIDSSKVASTQDASPLEKSGNKKKASGLTGYLFE
jgi:hypothetical protein